MYYLFDELSCENSEFHASEKFEAPTVHFHATELECWTY
jgi:hypothetical protein